jgi:hypothetical protein
MSALCSRCAQRQLWVKRVILTVGLLVCFWHETDLQSSAAKVGCWGQSGHGGRYLRVTRVTPLTFYREWMVQVAHQGAGALQVHGGLGRALAGTTYAGVRWSTLGYVEKVRPPGPLPPPGSH